MHYAETESIAIGAGSIALRKPENRRLYLSRTAIFVPPVWSGTKRRSRNLKQSLKHT